MGAKGSRPVGKNEVFDIVKGQLEDLGAQNVRELRAPEHGHGELKNLIKGKQIERAWYGRPGHSWDVEQGCVCTSGVQHILAAAQPCNFNLHFGDPLPGVPKELLIAVSDRRLSLKEWFEERYLQGAAFTLVDFKRDATESTFVHQGTGIRVWQDALDISGGKQSRVLFHYTHYEGFRNITEPSKEATEIWASLKTPGPIESEQDNAFYGQGLYCTALGPDDFHSQFCQKQQYYKGHKLLSSLDVIVDNNFRKMAQRDKDFKKYQFRVEYCIPVIVALENAYDVTKVQTPEMAKAGIPPGHNLLNNPMNVAGMPQREQWVVRVDHEGMVQGARSSLLETLQKRAQLEEEENCLYRYAAVLLDRGNAQDAMPHFRRIYEQYSRLWGPNNAKVLAAQGMWALALGRLSRFDEQQRISKDNFERFKKAEGESAPQTLISMRNWAYSVMNAGSPEKAEPIFKKCYELSKRAKGLGPNHPTTVKCYGSLALCLGNLGKVDEEVKMRKEQVADLTAKLGARHPDTLKAMANYARSLGDAKKYVEAEKMQRENYEHYREALGEKHPETLSAMGNWAFSLGEVGQHEEQIHWTRKRYNLSMETLGPEAESTVTAITNLAVALGCRDKEYEPLLRRCYETRCKTLGKDHPNTQRSYKNWQTALGK